MTKQTTTINDTIKATAKIFQNTEMNGNEFIKPKPDQYKGIERKMVIGGEEIEVNAQAFVSPLAYKYIIDLRDRPVFFEQIQNLDPNLRATKGMYMIKYVPKGSADRKKGRPWKIGQDLIRWDIRVSGPVEWNSLCEKIPELAWLKRNSTLTPNMFNIAVKHPGMSFWFTIKWDEYETYLEQQLEQLKLKLDKVFVSRKCSFSDYKELYKAQDKSLVLRLLNDVLDEVQEVESSPAVQKEMIAATGEATVTRQFNGQPKDPVTGRFVNKKQEQEER